MYPTIPAGRLAAVAAVLTGLVARHGHLRLIAGPLIVLIWGRVHSIAAQIEALLARMQAGTLRRHPARRPPRPAPAPRRRPAPGALPTGSAWLVALIPETAASGAQLQLILADPDVPALLEAAPQLRRALRPLCRMLGVKLPPCPPSPPWPDRPGPKQASPLVKPAPMPAPRAEFSPATATPPLATRPPPPRNEVRRSTRYMLRRMPLKSPSRHGRT